MTVSVFGGYYTTPRIVQCIGRTITHRLLVPGCSTLPRDTNSRGVEVVVLFVQTDKTLLVVVERRSVHLPHLPRPALAIRFVAPYDPWNVFS